MKNPLQIAVVLILVVICFMGCRTPVVKKPDLVEVWPDVVRGIFRVKTEAPYLIILLPEEERTAGSDFPALIVPAGPSGFDRFTPMAFLPDEEPPPAAPAPEPATPSSPEDSDDPDGDHPEEEAEESEAGDGDEDSPPDDMPPVNELEWPPVKESTDTPPWPEGLDPNSLTEEDIDEMLDDALRRAFEDEEPPEEGEGKDKEAEEEAEHPLEDRFWTPVIPPGLPSWWDPPEVPDISPKPDDAPDLDLRLPRWKDVDPGMAPPPGWPLGAPWPIDDGLRLPDRWRPDDDGFRLGGWRLYIIPLPGNAR